MVCRVFKKKCFFKVGGGSGGAGEGIAGRQGGALESHIAAEHSPSSLNSLHYLHPNHHHYLHHHHSLQYYSHANTADNASINPATTYQVQDLLTNHRPPTSGYDFAVLPGDSGAAAMLKAYEGADDAMQNERNGNHAGEWAVLEAAGLDGRFGAAPPPPPPPQQQMSLMGGQRGGEMDLWGSYGK